MKAQNGQHITLVGSLHHAEQCSVENVTIHGDDRPQEEHQQIIKKAQHPNGARSAISEPTSDKQRVFLLRRTYHVGNRVVHFATEVGEDNPDRDKIEITFTDTNGDVITTWYPRPGEGRLSGRWYDEELIYDRGNET